MNDTMRKFVRGLMVGMVSMGTLPESKEKVPIAYLYNGVQLPPLPEWDRESYPYAVMTFLQGTYKVYLFATEPHITVETLSNGGVLRVLVGEYAQANFELQRTSSKWLIYETSSEDIWLLFSRTGTKLWANFDLLNEDGTVYLAASEPVPVYE